MIDQDFKRSIFRVYFIVIVVVAMTSAFDIALAGGILLASILLPIIVISGVVILSFALFLVDSLAEKIFPDKKKPKRRKRKNG